jgi:hypothetical protein
MKARGFVLAALSVALGGTSLLSAPRALATPAPATSTTPAVQVCGQGPDVIKPASIILTCADAGEIARGLKWATWTQARATATGRVTWLTGRIHATSTRWASAAAHLTLSDPVSEAGGRVLFTRLNVRVTGSAVSKYMRDVTYSEAPPRITLLPPVPRARFTRTANPARSPAAASGTLAFAEIEGFWVDAGGPTGDVTTIDGTFPAPAVAAALTFYESSEEPGNIQLDNPYSTTGWGLWQITPGNSESAYGEDYQLLDPWNNAEAAVLKCLNAQSADEQYGCWTPWTTYTTKPWYKQIPSTIPAPVTSLTDPGQYTPASDYTGAANNSSSPGSSFGPALNPYLASFEDNDSQLYGYEDFATAQGSNAGTTLGMDSGTSPSTAGLSDGSTYITAFQDNDNDLYLHDSNGTDTTTTLGMEAGTSPAVAALAANDEWEAAFQDNDNDLGLRSSNGTASVTTLGMDPGTSPAIAGSGSGWIVAFQDNDHDLYFVTSAGLGYKTTLGMQPGTSPAITALANGGFAAAFQSNTGGLYTFVTGGTSSPAIADGTGTQTQYGMDGASSPAIASYGDSWQVAFETNDQQLYTYLSNGTDVATTLGMAPGTSPSIAVEPDGSCYLIAFDDNDNDLYLHTSAGQNIGTTLGLQAGTSPGVSTPYL